MSERLLYLGDDICARIGTSYMWQREAVTVNARRLIGMSGEVSFRWNEDQLTTILSHALHNRDLVLVPVWYTGEDDRQWHRPGWYTLGAAINQTLEQENEMLESAAHDQDHHHLPEGTGTAEAVLLKQTQHREHGGQAQSEQSQAQIQGPREGRGQDTRQGG